MGHKCEGKGEERSKRAREARGKRQEKDMVMSRCSTPFHSALRVLLQRGGGVVPPMQAQEGGAGLALASQAKLFWCRSLTTSCSVEATPDFSPTPLTPHGSGPSTRTYPYPNAVTFNHHRRVIHKTAAATNGRAHALASSRSFSDDTTHSDFQTQYKPQSKIQDVAKVIENDVKSHKVFVYMKGIPEIPQCGFSNMVCRILEAYDIEFGSRNVLDDMEIRQGIKDFTSWPTIPQVFVDGEFMGGCDILMEMHKSGELEDVLKGETK